MKTFSKICDAADWFDPEVCDIISEELKEPARFHRKQWEFAMIFRSLQSLGMLHPGTLGLSMGGGKERLLYSIARHVKHLVVTDLYDPQTTWDCARTEDPDMYIKTDKPFDVDDTKIRALRMDMRALDFPDESFDFAYSTCAIEHIGGREDFLQHLNEVHRVLKDGGVYVLTTEFHFGGEVIADPENFIFSPTYLRDLFLQCRLAPEPRFDARITPHNVNRPLPTQIMNLCYGCEEVIPHQLFEQIPHVQLLRGRHPFSAALFVLKKSATEERPKDIIFDGFESSKELLDSGVEEYRNTLDSHQVHINPFSALPRRSSRFFADHAEFFREEMNARSGSPEVFHSDYFWFGSGFREFEVTLHVHDVTVEGSIELRIHRYRTLASTVVDCVAEEVVDVKERGSIKRVLRIGVDDDSCYAILAHVRNGQCMFNDIRILSRRILSGTGRPEDLSHASVNVHTAV